LRRAGRMGSAAALVSPPGPTMSAERPTSQDLRAEAGTRPLRQEDTAKGEADVVLHRHGLQHRSRGAVVDGAVDLTTWNRPLRLDALRRRAEEASGLPAGDVDEAATARRREARRSDYSGS